MATVYHTNEKNRSSSPSVAEETARITLKNNVRNGEMKTLERKLVHGNWKIKERRLRRFGHVLNMDNTRTVRQTTRSELIG